MYNNILRTSNNAFASGKSCANKASAADLIAFHISAFPSTRVFQKSVLCCCNSA